MERICAKIILSIVVVAILAKVYQNFTEAKQQKTDYKISARNANLIGKNI